MINISKSAKIIIAVILFVILLVAALFVFKYLTKKYWLVESTPDNQATTTSQDIGSDTSALNDGKKAADFTVYDAEGQPVTLSSLKGKSVVVNFWADWCPPCVSELPHFQKAYENYKDVVFMMVNVDSTPQLITAYVQRNGYSFPIYYDSEQSASKAYGIYTMPRTIFVDPDGNLVKTQVGMISEEALNEAIESIRR